MIRYILIGFTVVIISIPVWLFYIVNPEPPPTPTLQPTNEPTASPTITYPRSSMILWVSSYNGSTGGNLGSGDPDSLCTADLAIGTANSNLFCSAAAKAFVCTDTTNIQGIPALTGGATTDTVYAYDGTTFTQIFTGTPAYSTLYATTSPDSNAATLFGVTNNIWVGCTSAGVVSTKTCKTTSNWDTNAGPTQGSSIDKDISLSFWLASAEPTCDASQQLLCACFSNA